MKQVKEIQDNNTELSLTESFKRAMQMQLEAKVYQYTLANIPFKAIYDNNGNIVSVIEGEALSKVEGIMSDTQADKNENMEGEVTDNDIYWHNTKLEDNLRLPMPTYCLDVKQFCAKEYGALMVLSNKGVLEDYRFTYKNKFNTKELAKDLQIGRTTLEANIKKLERLECNVLSIENSYQGIIYKLNYGLKNEQGKLNKYITIHHKMLKELVCSFSNNAIKLYCVISFSTNEAEFTTLTEKWLCEQIGLSSKSENNQTTVRTIVKTLEKAGFIKTKVSNSFKWDNIRKKQIPLKTKQYRLCSFSEWNELDSKLEHP